MKTGLIRDRLVRTTAISILSFAALMVGGVTPANPLEGWYEIEELPPLASTERCKGATNATGINELGHVVGLAELASDIFDPWGNWFDCRFENHAVIWRNGEIVDLSYLDSDMPYANGKGINDHDEVVGQGMGAIPPWTGGWGMPTVWLDDVSPFNPAADIDNPIGWAWGINNAGQVAMQADWNAYLWDPHEGLRRIHFPDDPGWRPGANAWEINNAGLVVGEAPHGSDPYRFNHAFRYDSVLDTIDDLHVDDDYYRSSVAYGLNDRGDVVGRTEAFTNHEFAQLWKQNGDAVLVPLDDPEFAYAQMEHINNHGFMVGRDLGRILPRRLVGWIGVEVPDRLLEFEPAGETGELPDRIVIDPGSGTGPRTIRKIALLDLISEEDRADWSRLNPFEINDAGEIVGIGLYKAEARGFKMTPRVPIEIALEEAPEISPAAAAPVTAAVPRSATEGVPDFEAVVSSMRGPEGTFAPGRFQPLQVRYGRDSAIRIDVDPSDPTAEAELRSYRRSCETDDPRCGMHSTLRGTPGEEDPGTGTKRQVDEDTPRNGERDRLERN